MPGRDGKGNGSKDDAAASFGNGYTCNHCLMIILQ